MSDRIPQRTKLPRTSCVKDGSLLKRAVDLQQLPGQVP